MPNLKTFSSLANPVYRLYYWALLCQMASMNMQMVARALLIYRLTGSAMILGGVALAHALPMLFLSLFGGVIADRLPKKHVLLIGQAGSAVVSLGIALSLSFGYLSVQRAGSWWILMIASVFQGIIMGLMMPSRQAIIYEIVNPKQLMNAVALNSLGTNVLRLLGPAFAGFLIDAISFGAVYYTMTGLYLTAVVFVFLMPATGGTPHASGANAIEGIKEGFGYIRRHRTILYILIYALFAVVLSMPYMLLLPIFTDDILGTGATGMGILLSASGIGAMVGSLFLASLPNKRRGMMMLASGLIIGIALTGFSFSASWHISIAWMALVGIGTAGRVTMVNTLLQYYVDDAYRGRVMSIYIMEFGLTSLGTFTAGLLTEVIGVQWAVGGFAMTLALISLLALVFLPRIRKLD